MEQNIFTEETPEFVSVAEPIPANSITPTFSELSPQSPEKNSASNSGITGNSGSEAPDRNHKGQFVPGHPYRFLPGQSGNPNGRPRRKKARPLSGVLRARLAQPFPDAPESSYAELIGDLILKSALKGNLRSHQRPV